MLLRRTFIYLLLPLTLLISGPGAGNTQVPDSVSLYRIAAVEPVPGDTIPPVSRDTATAARRPAGLPLRPARTLSFTAREGSWISLDVSPDGFFFIF